MSSWLEKDNYIQKEFVLKNFTEAINFTNKVARESEKVNHHPDILIHDYKKVTITLTTHDQSMVTEKDWVLSRAIDSLLR